MPKGVLEVLLHQWLLTTLISAISAVVFLFFDVLDAIMCLFFKVVDELLEGKPISSCYCSSKLEEQEREVEEEEEVNYGENEMSETLYSRQNLFREMMGFLGIRFFLKERPSVDDKRSLILRNGKRHSNRWSDCGCESCREWFTKVTDDFRLHVVVKEPHKGGLRNIEAKKPENVIFLHGFLSSSSIWTQTVFPNLSAKTAQNYRMFAVDLLGFGRSPKPLNCFYTIKDHIEMIEKSVISSYELDTFHIVAHSMGCVIALALAAKYIKSVKSIVLVAPPYFPCSKEKPSSLAFEKLAPKKIWPPLVFGSAFMSWYEHLGRCVCFIICRHHKTWEWFLKLLTRKRELHFMVVDMTRHTHHSAWHSMHNVISGGAKLMDNYLEALVEAKTKMSVFQGDLDEVVPLECSKNIKFKVPDSELNVIANANHNSVILGREKDFTRDLECVWRGDLI